MTVGASNFETDEFGYRSLGTITKLRQGGWSPEFRSKLAACLKAIRQLRRQPYFNACIDNGISFDWGTRHCITTDNLLWVVAVGCPGHLAPGYLQWQAAVFNAESLMECIAASAELKHNPA